MYWFRRNWQTSIKIKTPARSKTKSHAQAIIKLRVNQITLLPISQTNNNITLTRQNLNGKAFRWYSKHFEGFDNGPCTWSSSKFHINLEIRLWSIEDILWLVQGHFITLYWNYGKSSSITLDIKKIQNKNCCFKRTYFYILVRFVEVQRVCFLKSDRFQRSQLSSH